MQVAAGVDGGSKVPGEPRDVPGEHQSQSGWAGDHLDETGLWKQTVRQVCATSLLKDES